MTTKGWYHNDRGKIYVGARDEERQPKYEGPSAEVTFDETWLHIITDKYEGHVMLNIETLPCLQKALAHVARKRRATLSVPSDDGARGQ